MTPAPVIALTGVSGVGKTRLARAIALARPEILRLSASKLLKSSLHTTGERLRTAASAAVRGNQAHLAAALHQAREGQWEHPVLIEAHSFIDNDRELVDVPTEVMRDLQVAGFLAIEATGEEIARRRMRDERRRPPRSAEELDRQQRHARRVLARFAEELDVPLRFVTSDERERALDFIDEIVAAGAR